jgi:hypothetical protein
MQSMNKLRRAISNPKGAFARMVEILLELYIATWNAALEVRTQRVVDGSDLCLYNEIIAHASERTDISDHLGTMFVESTAVRPALIVELGVRGGESTFVLERVARLFGARLVSVDIQDCARVSSYPERDFVRCDDIVFASQFPDWCQERDISPVIDLLFIDTSHELEHTVQEIVHWFPMLSDRAKVFFHDTNMKRVFTRRDGSLGLGWRNKRGVIAAIEHYLGRRLNETHDFTCFAGEWLIKHHANCSGFTVMERWRRALVVEPTVSLEKSTIENRV